LFGIFPNGPKNLLKNGSSKNLLKLSGILVSTIFSVDIFTTLGITFWK